jgi:hypothetical protein
VQLPLIVYVVILVQSSVVLLGGFRYRSLPHSLRILEWFLVVTLGVVVMGVVLSLFHVHNLWLSHLYTLIELMFIVLLYSSWIKQKQTRSVLLVSLLVFFVFWIVSKFTFEPFSIDDGWTATFSKVLQIIFSALLLVEVVRENEIVWMNDMRLWVVTGIVVYASGTLFLFAFFNRMLQISPDRLKIIWSLNWILTIITNLLFARAFLCKT